MLRTVHTISAIVVSAVLSTGMLYAENELLGRARQYYEATEYSKAISILDGKARDARSLELLGRAYLQAGDYRNATETLEKAAALEPQDSGIATWLARAYGHRAETSFATTALHYANRTREEFQRALELDPANRDALGDLFDFYLQAPSIVGGGVGKAHALLHQIKKHDPVGYELAEAKLAEHDKNYESAEAHLRRAVTLAPDKQGVYIDLAKFLARRGRHEESEAQFHRARELASASRRVDFEEAETWVRFHRNPDEARRLLRDYAASPALTPNDPPRTEALRLLRKAEGG